MVDGEPVANWHRSAPSPLTAFERAAGGMARQQFREVKPADADPRYRVAWKSMCGYFEHEFASIMPVAVPPDFQRLGQAVKKVFGQEVLFFESEDPQCKTIAGVRVPGVQDAVFVNVRSHKPHLYVVMHEVTHMIQDAEPDLWLSVRRALAPYMRDRSGYGSTVESAQSLHKRMNVPIARANQLREAIIDRELVADTLGEYATQPEFWSKMEIRLGARPLGRLINYIRAGISQVFEASGLRRPKTDGYRSAFSRHWADLNEVRTILDRYMDAFIRRRPAAANLDLTPTFARDYTAGPDSIRPTPGAEAPRL